MEQHPEHGERDGNGNGRTDVKFVQRPALVRIIRKSTPSYGAGGRNNGPFSRSSRRRLG